jgi:nucleoside-diphosphate-sugar epimerase
MRRALIGHTGFVGSTLNRQQRFDATFNSANIAQIAGQTFDEVWCAGVQAVKWWANQNAAADWAGIEALLAPLAGVKAARFVLISTVDVYPDPVGVTETSPVAGDDAQPYGLHRRRVEDFVAERFPVHHLLRLPGLFGQGLKKNLVFDILDGRPLDGFDSRSTFQFYDLAGLSDDSAKAIGAGLERFNFAVEPVSVAAVVKRLTGRDFENHLPAGPIRYDMQTAHAAAWGRTGPYIQSAEEVLDALTRFAAAQGAAA